MPETVSLDTKAQRRLHLLTGVIAGRLTTKAAAATLGISARQVRRLVQRFEKEGAAALVHGNRGRPPANRVPDETRTRILKLVESEYSGFNDAHLCEALERDHDISVGRETLRTLLRSAGRKPKRTRRPPKHRRRREPRPRRGMMVQWDGSHHAWLGPEHPRFVLMAAVDDADGRLVAARFTPSESGAAYLLLLDDMLRAQGIPESIYQDRHGALRRSDGSWSLEEQLAGAQSPTQIGIVLQELGIQPIFARSSQGKGRIERFFGVAQDRLIAEMLRSGVSTLDEANAFLEDYWISAYNTRFGRTAAQPGNFYCEISDEQRRQVVSFRYRRVVSHDNLVRLGDVEIQIPPGPGRRSYAKVRVDVRQHTDGTWTIWHDGDAIATHSATPLRLPTKASVRRRKTTRGAQETIQVYFTPSDHELQSEVARLS